MSIYFSLTEKYSSSEYGAKKSKVQVLRWKGKVGVLRVDQGTWWSVYFNSAGLDPRCWFCLESYWLASSSYLCTHNTQKQIACCSSLPLIIPHPSINFGPVIVFFSQDSMLASQVATCLAIILHRSKIETCPKETFLFRITCFPISRYLFSFSQNRKWKSNTIFHFQLSSGMLLSTKKTSWGMSLFCYCEELWLFKEWTMEIKQLASQLTCLEKTITASKVSEGYYQRYTWMITGHPL